MAVIVVDGVTLDDGKEYWFKDGILYGDKECTDEVAGDVDLVFFREVRKRKIEAFPVY